MTVKSAGQGNAQDGIGRVPQKRDALIYPVAVQIIGKADAKLLFKIGRKILGVKPDCIRDLIKRKLPGVVGGDKFQDILHAQQGLVFHAVSVAAGCKVFHQDSQNVTNRPVDPGSSASFRPTHIINNLGQRFTKRLIGSVAVIGAENTDRKMNRFRSRADLTPDDRIDIYDQSLAFTFFVIGDRTAVQLKRTDKGEIMKIQMPLFRSDI